MQHESNIARLVHLHKTSAYTQTNIITHLWGLKGLLMGGGYDSISILT